MSSRLGFLLSITLFTILALPAGMAGQTASGGAPRYTGGVHTRAMITQLPDDSKRVTLAGNTRAAATAENDRGALPDSFPMDHMWLQLQRPPEMETELVDLIDQMNRPGSPNYHQWLTADEFGTRYGLAPLDIQKITDWLGSHGFKIDGVLPSGMIIEFSGNAGQVRDTFHTEIHSLNVAGESHIANMRDPQIPVALAGAVKGIVSLHNFRPHTNFKRHADFTLTGGSPSSTFQAVAPADLATIYNLNPLFAEGITGAGQTIAVVEDTLLANVSDVATFRTAFGLSGGSFSQITATGTAATCNNSGVSADEAEAAIDAEWAGASAPGAAVLLASCADTTTVFGGLIALQNLINGASPPRIVSMSYGECESLNGATANQSYLTTYQQAAALGISVFVAAGDEGAASCDANKTVATHGIAVSGFASTPYNVAVGGTDFSDTYSGTVNTYWNSTNTGTFASALSYVPETPWDDSCATQLIYTFQGFTQGYGATGFCNSVTGKANFRTTGAGSGGPSAYSLSQPSWQTGVFGLPAQSGGVRYLPDVSLFAANGVWNHFLVYCLTDTNQGGGPCTYTNATDTLALAAGGTSFAAPIMAGIMALVNQNAGSNQGLPNTRLYAMAAAEYGASGSTVCNASLGASSANTCFFHDVTLGDIDVNCTGTNCFGSSGTGARATDGSLSTSTTTFSAAYAAATGWDFATGIGSVNAYNLVNGWVPVASTTTVTSGLNPSATNGVMVTFTASIASITNNNQPVTGTVAWSSNTGCGTTTVTAGSPGVATCVTSVLPAGADTVTATYSGDITHNTSNGSVAQQVNPPTPPTVTFTGAPANAAYKSTFAVATTTNDGATATILATGPCTVSAYIITMTGGTGTCSLSASWTAIGVYASATVPQTTTATTTAPTMTFTGAPLNAAYGSTFTVAATTNASTTALIGASGACSVSGGTVTMISGTGACSLTASWTTDGNYSAATLPQTTGATKIAPGVTFTGAPVSAAYGSTFTVAATTNASTTASISASGACSVSGGTVTMTSGTGTCSLTANWAADNNYNLTSLSQTTAASTVAPVLPGPQSGSATYGVPTTLTVTINTVNGEATPTGTVTFQFTGGNNIALITSSPVFYICSNGAVQTQSCQVTLDGTGKASVTTSSLPTGTDGITATYSGNSQYSGGEQTTLNFSIAQANTQTSLSITPNSPAPVYGTTLTLSATVADNTANSMGTPTGTAQFAYSVNGGSTWTSLGSAVTLNGTGAAQIQTALLPAGTPTVRISYSGDANFGASTTTVTQTIAPMALSVTGITAQNKPYDGTTTATLNTSGEALSGVINQDNVSLAGTATGAFSDPNAGAGKTVTITGLTLAGSAVSNYTLTAPSAIASITKVAASVTPNAASAIYGQPDPSFSGTLSGFLPGDGVTAAYSRTAGTGVAGSPYTISATLSPSGVLGNYTIAYNTANFTVSQATPVISWSTPAAVIYGSALSSIQLNATSSVPGTFAYIPAAGSVPAVGTDPLSVIFTPTDATDYTTATGSTSIVVNPASAPASPANLIVTKVLTRDGNNNVLAAITVSNTGGTGAANIVITSVKIGSDTATPLPQTMGTVAAGTSASVTVQVPGSVGASGSASSITIAGTYTGGTLSSSSRITLP